MKVKILGCSGGIGGSLQRTTALEVDHDILIDAGTGAADLSLAELAAIDHVFLTHAHLDHIAALPLMIDSVADLRDRPLTVYGSSATLAALRQHIFNWVIWPDFSEIPNRERAVMRYQTLEIGQTIRLGQRKITALPAEHTVPAAGYQLDSGTASFVFTGDTTVNERFWPVVNAIANLRYLVIETAFANRDRALATASKHLCPSLLASELARLQGTPEIYITHLKPGQSAQTMREIEECAGSFAPRMLENGQVFEF